MQPRHVAVIDIGKTNAKVALVDLDVRCELAARRKPNRVRLDGPYPHHDVDELWTFILEGLAALRRDYPIDAIAVTTHGATAALVGLDGKLTLPVLDYEFDGPDQTRGLYDVVRPQFSETGSSALPSGLNLGAQLFWIAQTFAQAFERTASILTYPQYWAWRLCGVMASERTSLGCHTDLWNPVAGDFSELVARCGWQAKFPAVKGTASVLGMLHPDVAEKTGLDRGTVVLNGIHDSNASLYPNLVDREAPFAVLSTGTWVVAMAIGGSSVSLDPTRDTLINVNAFGSPVPSSRFMGGREFELLMADQEREWSDADLAALLDKPAMLLPSVVTGSGPFSNRTARWAGHEPTNGERFVAVSFYLALMASTCLALIGADGETVVEGPFATNEPFIAMLNAATGRPVVTTEGNGTGTSIGAAMLAGGGQGPGQSRDTIHNKGSDAMRSYHERWQELVREARTHV